MGIDTREHFLNTTPIQHFRQVSFVLRSSVLLNQRLRIALNLNEHLLSGGENKNEAQLFDKTAIQSEKDMEVIRLSDVENCFYQGTVIGEPGSMVTLSTCDGLWGLLAFANGSALGIWPLEGGDKGKRHPHVLFRVFGNGTECGGGGESSNDIEGQQQEKFIKRRRKRTKKSRGKRKSEGEENLRRLRQQRLFLDIALLVNKEMQYLFNIGQQKLLEYSLNALNIADLIFKKGLNIRISLNYFALIENLNKNNSNQLLDNLLDFTINKLYKEEKDVTIYLTNLNKQKQQNNIALNVDNSVCSGRAVGFTQIFNLYGPQTAALSFAHSLGHILGLEHDLAECGCDMEECIMSGSKGQFDHFPWHFSACSSARLERKRSADQKMECLLKSNNLFSQFSPSFLCGNGQVDQGEECDCGRRDQCSDPCCDPFTCRLRPHANCAAHEECCHRCHVRPSGHLCRPTRSICDVAERCDGKSGECPPDSHLLDGTHCGLGNNGQCWQGDCVDSDEQCREIWGKGSRVAESLCFSKNGHALEYGNCGRDTEGKFVECAPENERCGLLQCHEGSASPTIPNATAFAFQFVQEERQVQCKVVTNSPLGFVKDGTSCGEGRVCIRTVCLPLAQVSPSVKCPSSGSNISQCSGHGDCTSAGQCLCFDGWTGKACDLRTPNRRTDNHHSPSLEFSSLRDISTRFVGVSDGKIINSGGHRIGFAFKTTNPRRLNMDPPNGVLDPKEAINIAISCDAFDPAAEATNNDRVTVEWTNTPEGAAKQFRREWFQGDGMMDSLSLKSRESSIAINNVLINPQQQQISSQQSQQQQTSLNIAPIISEQYQQSNCSPPQSLQHSPTIQTLNYQQNNNTGIFFSKRGGSNSLEMAETSLPLSEGGDVEEEAMLFNSPFGPRLANISLLMRKLEGTTEEERSTPPLLANWSVPPPASADSGNPGSNLELRESPSLFSDPYRLDLPG
uniref:Uncharacterized protein n=4 Tax=Meloidogyne TaxID=189290 RepID=A0A915N443_MELJA